MRTDVDVIVLGAGLAGLAAAQRLSEASKTVTLVEARDRIGGRVWTRHDADVDYPIELGPEWFDSSGAVHRLLAGSHVRMHEAAGPFLRRTAAGIRKTDEPGRRDNDLRRRLREIGGADRPLADALDDCCRGEEYAGARAALLEYVQGFHAADPTGLSLQWLLQAEDNQPAEVAQFRSRDGVDCAVTALRAGLDTRCTVRLSTVVRAVRWRPGIAEVEIENAGAVEMLVGQSAIVTLPLSVLTASPGVPGAVRFSPGLRTKQPAFAGLAMGPAIKVVLVFDEAFWRGSKPLDGMLFIQDVSQPMPTWWTTQPVDAPVLTGWVAGPKVAALRNVRGDALRDAALDSVSHALGVSRATVEAHLRSWHSHDWQADPFARGAYSWVLAGGVDAHRVLAQPLDDTLFFAGEATCGEGLNATMDGAIQSGWRAASEVLMRHAGVSPLR